LEQIYCSHSRTPKIQNGFLQFLLLVLRSTFVAKHVNAKRMSIIAMGVLSH